MNPKTTTKEPGSMTATDAVLKRERMSRERKALAVTCPKSGCKGARAYPPIPARPATDGKPALAAEERPAVPCRKDGTNHPERHERADAVRDLRRRLKPGAEVQVLLRHRARSGMVCDVSLMLLGESITATAATALGEPLRDVAGSWAIRLHGAGMDMGFHVVYVLSSVLYPYGFACAGKDKDGRSRCNSNDHTNGDRDYSRGHRHTGNGGYALRHRWL